MKKGKTNHPKKGSNFSEFIEDPPIAASLLVFGLVALVLAILEFGKALGY